MVRSWDGPHRVQVVILIAILLVCGAPRLLRAQSSPFTPANLLVSRSVYHGTALTVTVGEHLPGKNATTFTGSETTTSGNVASTSGFNVGDLVQITMGGTTFERTLTAKSGSKLTWGLALQSAPGNGDRIAQVSLAVADGSYPGVWANEALDPSFGVTSPIMLDEMTVDGTVVQTVPVNGMVTSFPSKSELGLNLSPDGSLLTFMGYNSAENTIDVSNSNTPGHIDATDPVGSVFQRAVGQFDKAANLSVTPVNAYSGNNGRAAISTNGIYYMVGNAGNGSGTEPLNVINNTGVQALAIGGGPETTAIGKQNGTCSPVVASNGCQFGFATGNAGLGDDKSGKDDNFRGITIFNNTLYATKGSGSNGVNTVYQVGTQGTLPTIATAATTPITILSGLPNTLARDTTVRPQNPFAIWFANANTLYVADEGDGTIGDPNAGLQKWVSSDGTNWTRAYILQSGLNLGTSYHVAGYNPSIDPSPAGLRNLTGRLNNDGTATIWAVTSTTSANTDQGADPNQLVVVTDVVKNTDATVADSEAFTLMRTAQFGEVLRGVSFTPGTINPVWTTILKPIPNAYGWNNTDVSVIISADQVQAGVQSIQYALTGAETGGQTVNGSQANTVVNQEGQTKIVYSAHNSAGSSSSTLSLMVKVDKTAPVITPALTPQNGTGPTAFAWYNSPVTVSFTCSDPVPASGLASGVQSCSNPTTLQEGANQSVTGMSQDFAGNQSQKQVSANVDLTAPIITFTGNAGSYTVDQSISISCTATDALSGIASSTCPGANGPAYQFSLGSNVLNATATDRAGNQTNASTHFTVGTTFSGLSNLTQQFVNQQGIANALVAKLQEAENAAVNGNVNAKAGALNAYMNQVTAQAGKALATGQATTLIQLAGAL